MPDEATGVLPRPGPATLGAMRTTSPATSCSQIDNMAW